MKLTNKANDEPYIFWHETSSKVEREREDKHFMLHLKIKSKSAKSWPLPSFYPFQIHKLPI